MYAAMLHHPQHGEFQLPSLRLCVSGGAALPLEIMRSFEAAFGCPILEGYGLSETAPVASFNQRDRPRKPGSIGTPIEGVEMRLVDDSGGPVSMGKVGEIMVRGPNVMKGYWHAAGGHRGGLDARRVAAHRRPGQDRRGRLLLHRRPQEGHDHPRRLQRLQQRGGGGALRAPRGARVRSRPRAPSGAGRGGGGGGRASARQLGDGGQLRDFVGSGLPPTSTRGWSGSSRSCPRMPRARS